MPLTSRRAFLRASLLGLASGRLLRADVTGDGVEPSEGTPFRPDTLFLTWQRDPTTTMTVQWIGTPGETSDTAVSYSPLKVDTVGDGNQALDALTGQNYSILITDLKMPRLDGIQLIEEVTRRRMPVTVIVTTGHGSIDEAVHAMRLGAYDFITKPVDIEHLSSEIAKKESKVHVLVNNAGATWGAPRRKRRSTRSWRTSTAPTWCSSRQAWAAAPGQAVLRSSPVRRASRGSSPSAW